jgi:hypothetical protein
MGLGAFEGEREGIPSIFFKTLSTAPLHPPQVMVTLNL